MTQLEKMVLFSKPLAFQSTASLEDCMKRFKSHEVRWERIFQSSTTVVTLNRRNETVCEVDIRAKRASRGTDYTTAHVIGKIEAKSDGNTIFYGHIKLGMFYLAIIGSTPIIIISLMATSPWFNPIILFLAVATIGYFTVNMLNDRKRLIRAVESAMMLERELDK